MRRKARFVKYLSKACLNPDTTVPSPPTERSGVENLQAQKTCRHTRFRKRRGSFKNGSTPFQESTRFQVGRSAGEYRPEFGLRRLVELPNCRRQDPIRPKGVSNVD